MENRITRFNWHRGTYRKLSCTKTLEGYYDAVSDFVRREGEPIATPMLLVRNCTPEEVKTENWGASWTTNLFVCHDTAMQYKMKHILLTLVSPNELAVHYNAGEDIDFYEEEYVLDIKNHHNPILRFEDFLEIEGEYKWHECNEGKSLKTINNYKDSYADLYQELLRPDVHIQYQSLVRSYLKKNSVKLNESLCKLIRENKALGVSVDFRVEKAPIKSGVVTKMELSKYIHGLGIEKGSKPSILDVDYPGIKKLSFQNNSQEIGFYISSKLAKVI